MYKKKKKKETFKTKWIERDMCVECIVMSQRAWLETSCIWITHIVTLTSPEWITHGLSPPMCAGIWSVQCSGPAGGHVHSEHFMHAHAPAALHTQLLAFPMPICSEDVCQCSIKIPSDKRFKWLPLWVMRSRISEEALTAQHMKTDELDCPSLPEAGAGTVPHYH